MAQPLSLPTVGTRLAHAGSLGTVRFVGPVEGTQGTWIGVEWDDPKRGKHDGEKNGTRYFSCTVKNAGSFIRPTAAVSYGTSFLQALTAKYTDNPHGEAVEKVILGSSNGAIEVEAVRLNKIRANLARLDTLREVSLDDQQISRADTPGEIHRTCPGIRGLDLSKNLIPSWDIVALVVTELPLLKRLAVNQNRLAMPQDTTLFAAAFSTIQELQLSSTLTPWIDIQQLIRHMPCLTVIECGYNRLTTLPEAPGNSVAFTQVNTPLRTVNFDGNELCIWKEVVAALRCYTNLERVVLSRNRVQRIDPLGATAPFDQLRYLSLTSNGLKSWTDIDQLHPWCPALESLSLVGNPLVEDPELGKHARQFVVAKIPTLVTMNAAAITPRERTDCELFYISYINQHGPRDEEERCQQHPRWKALCSKYGAPDAPAFAGAEAQDKLSNHLFKINVHRCSRSPSNSTPSITQTMTLRILPTMSLRTLRLKVAKSFGVRKTEQTSMRLWLKMPDGTYADLPREQDTQDLSWLGFEDDSDIMFCIL
ncbi:hypothetical protein BC835DRAFT_173148 [Cytidiella melzeri]|nr:hypothetical protein BC835DRAFT_173148 [Cytidiella melzeri]